MKISLRVLFLCGCFMMILTGHQSPLTDQDRIILHNPHDPSTSGMLDIINPIREWSSEANPDG